jgi:hypothetical protein
MTIKHFSQSDRYNCITEKPSESYGSAVVRAYDRKLKVFTDLPLVVVEATPVAKVSTVFSGNGVYEPLACPVDFPAGENFFYDKVLTNLDRTHRTERIDGVITKIRRNK